MSKMNIEEEREKFKYKREHIPEGVISEEYYFKYLDVYEDWKLNERYYEIKTISHEKKPIDITVDFCGAHFQIQAELNKIGDDAVIKEIEEKLRKKNLLKAKLAEYKGKAYGTCRSEKSPKVKDSVIDSRKTEALELFGKFYNAVEVHRILVQEYGLDCSIGSVDGFRVANIDRIKELQEEYLKDYTEIRLTHKKSRLEELNELYVGRKNIYSKTNNRDDYKLLLQTIEQIKREVEGDVLTINGHIDINIEQTITSHIYQELIKGLILKEIIISRVAARTNTNPAYLMSRLNNSYYAKFNGFGINDGQEAEISLYPSQIIYNFEDINNLHENKKIEQKDLSSFPQLGEEQKKEEIDIKKLLLDKLKKKQSALDDTKSTLGKYDKKGFKSENDNSVEFEDIK